MSILGSKFALVFHYFPKIGVDLQPFFTKKRLSHNIIAQIDVIFTRANT
jgi:hypothetical protein